MPGTIFCATSLLAGQKIDARAPRTRQSEAARKLLDGIRVGFAAPVGTMSHSRGAIAVAAGDGDGLSLGIDIEWMQPDRPFASLTNFLLGDLPERRPGPAEFYRAWTFFEAYFKAFQRFPPRAGLCSVMEQADGDDVRRLPDNTRVLQFRVAGEFQVSLVWRAPKMCAVRLLPDLDGHAR